MFDLSVLTVPLLAFVVSLAGMVWADTGAVYIAEISVPQSLQVRGYRPEIIVQRLEHRMNEITQKGHSQIAGYSLETDFNAPNPSEILATEFGVLSLIRSIQRSAGLIKVVIEGHITETNGRLTFALLCSPVNQPRFELSATSGADFVNPLISQMGDQIMSRIDPYTYGVYLYRTNRISWNFDELDKLLAIQLNNPDTGRRPLFHNLAALRALTASDDDAAIAHLNEAIAEAPHPGLFEFNLGLIHHRRQRYTQAIEQFERTLGSASDLRLLAAAHAEIGDALEHLGEPGKADEHFAQALALSPRLAQVYFLRAHVLRARGDEAAANKAMAEGKLYEPEQPNYTEVFLSLFRFWDDSQED